MSKRPSDNDLELLLRCLEACGVEIREENCGSEGGLVRMKDCHILFLSDLSSPERKKLLCIEALRKLGGPGLHLPPRVRRLLGEEEWNE